MNAAADPAGKNRRGITAMVAATASFSLSDACVKLTAETVPASQIMVIRGLMACALVMTMIVVLRQTTALPQMLRPLVLWRAGAEAIIITLFIAAIAKLSLGTITAISQTSPLMTAAVALIWLHQPVGWRRWLAIGTGFAGVALIVRPSLEGIDRQSAMALGVAAFVTARDFMTRSIGRSVPAMVIALATTLAGVAVGTITATLQPWREPSSFELGLLALGAIMVSLGNFFVVQAFREADIAVVSPFRYTIVAFALLLGFLVWHDVPDLLAIAGIGLIVASGYYLIRQEIKGSNGPAPTPREVAQGADR
jgi:drug/metabolite transporter (DMT)-like permease